jgi:hypothetical protein
VNTFWIRFITLMFVQLISITLFIYSWIVALGWPSLALMMLAHLLSHKLFYCHKSIKAYETSEEQS